MFAGHKSAQSIGPFDHTDAVTEKIFFAAYGKDIPGPVYPVKVEMIKREFGVRILTD
jgi:hypothetical protein